MMTGQILAGADPSEAARYQMVIMFLLGAAATLGAVASIYAAVLHLIDGGHRLRPDRLIPKSGGGGLGGALAAAWASARGACCCCFGRGRRGGGGGGGAGDEARRPLLGGGGGGAAAAPAARV